MEKHTITGDEPVYPDPIRGAVASLYNQSPNTEPTGLTKREYIAIKALQGLCASGMFTEPKIQRQCENIGSNISQGIAASALDIADALIIELNRPIKQTT